MKKGVALLLASVLSISIIGCEGAKNEKSSSTMAEADAKKAEANKIVDPKVENQGQTIQKSKKDGTNQQSTSSKFQMKDIGEAKKDVTDMMPSLTKDIQSLLARSLEINEHFDMTETQVLLISNLNRTAYLLNSQNPEYGTADEVIEYSTETFKDKSFMTQPFFNTEFNGKDTYVFNVDFLSMRMGSEYLKDETLSFFIHEAFHIYYHKGYLHEHSSAERASGALRGDDYPVNAEERINRAQMLYYYQQALKSDNEGEKIENIKKANYFYEQYLEQNEENQLTTKYDQLEGYARYVEYRSLSMLDASNKTEADLVQSSTNILLADDEQKESLIPKKSRQTGFYAVGSCGYALVYELGLEKELGDGHQLQFLLDYYGTIEAESNKVITEKVLEECERINSRHQAKVENIIGQMEDENMVNIKIPSLSKYKENSSASSFSSWIRFDYKGDQATISTMSVDIKLGANRVKLTQTEVLSRQFEDGTYYNVFVPREDVTIEGSKMTVQTKGVQLYDVEFEIQDGEYVLVE